MSTRKSTQDDEDMDLSQALIDDDSDKVLSRDVFLDPADDAAMNRARYQGHYQMESQSDGQGESSFDILDEDLFDSRMDGGRSPVRMEPEDIRESLIDGGSATNIFDGGDDFDLAESYLGGDDEMESRDGGWISSDPVPGSNRRSDSRSGGEARRPISQMPRNDQSAFLTSAAGKDSIIANILPDDISECAIYTRKKHGEPCISDEMVKEVARAVGSQQLQPRAIMQDAKEKLSCGTERCVLEKVADRVGEEKVRREIGISLKVAGPTDNTWLGNTEIDSTMMMQWGRGFPDFYPYNFNMLDYASYSWRDGRVLDKPDTLATVRFDNLYSKGMRRAGCIINSGKYESKGKHWMALFADSTDKDRWTVEFFNSSGNNPAPEWVSWLVKIKSQMESIIEKMPDPKPKVEVISVTTIRHQKSKSECGVYSLFYIWARLNGVEPEYFLKNAIPDKLMFEFRQHLFRNDNIAPLARFDWDKYQKITNIKWESITDEI